MGKIVCVDYDRLEYLLARYKSEFSSRIEYLAYKWDTLCAIRSRWNLEIDALLPLMQIYCEECGKLVELRHLRSIVELSERFPEGVRCFLNSLYDETIPLNRRVESFRREVESITREHLPHSVVSLYLWLRYPERYYIYNPMYAHALFRELNYKVKLYGVTITSLISAYTLYDNIAEIIAEDSDITTVIDKMAAIGYNKAMVIRIIVTDFVQFVYPIIKEFEEWSSKHRDQYIAR